MKTLVALVALLSTTVLAQDPGPHRVIKAVDGDTLRLEMNGVPQTVRLIGVDTPETVHPFLGVEPFGPEASAFTKELVTGKEVALEFDIGRRDRYGRLLVYAILPDGRELNLLLAQSGLASVMAIPPNVAQADVYRAAVAGARSVGKGMWSTYPGAWNFIDRNCDSFESRKLAVAFYGGAGPGDPHDLDRDNDGLACEKLP
jgi:micrococcal nuclease